MKPRETQVILDSLDVIMPHGKHKGKRLGDIPSGYLYWVAENWDDDVIATAADTVWKDREELGGHFH